MLQPPTSPGAFSLLLLERRLKPKTTSTLAIQFFLHCTLACAMLNISFSLSFHLGISLAAPFWPIPLVVHTLGRPW